MHRRGLATSYWKIGPYISFSRSQANQDSNEIKWDSTSRLDNQHQSISWLISSMWLNAPAAESPLSSLLPLNQALYCQLLGHGMNVRHCRFPWAKVVSFACAANCTACPAVNTESCVAYINSCIDDE